MAGGGTFLSYNKVRAGAYINFKAVPKSSMTVGDRGIVAMGLDLDWGAEGELIEVLSSDMIDGNSRKKVGFTIYDSESKLLGGALNYCYKALVYRMNTGGIKATATIGRLTVTAKYAGTYGNKIIITIERDATTGIYTVITYVDGSVMNTQKVASISELEANDYVVFTEADEGDFIETAGTPLEGGVNGTTQDSVAYPAMFALLKKAGWQTYVCFSNDVSIKSTVVTFITQMREDEGKYVQGVVCNYDGADYEGIINSISGAVIDGVTYNPVDFVAIVGGMTAGSNINESNTARIINGATSIIGDMTNAEIITALNAGKFLLSAGSDGSVRVEKDINSLHNFTVERPYAFSKNRVIRVLDEIGTTVKLTWERTYMGKVDNNEVGRGLFKADVIQYCFELQRLNALQEFKGSSDIEVMQGNDLDVVICNLWVKPVDSMEKLYFTVNVNS